MECIEYEGRFTLWPKVERPPISTNQIARNQEFNLSTLHTMAWGDHYWNFRNHVKLKNRFNLIL
jgi:hypothetical protein